MSRYYGGWAPYVPVSERRRHAERAIAKLRKTGHPVAPVTIAGRVIATTFWGRAWCDNMESYHDYESRLPRGRTYVRSGLVVDLQIAQGRISAMVSGSELYNVTITVKEAAKTLWRAICADCTGGVASLVELLQGRLSKGVMERLCRQQGGLFPRPSEIRFKCSCPDHAAMCKHVAAVFYGVGARLDQQPELLFRLRAVDANDLLAGAGEAWPLSKTGPGVGRVLQTDDMAALFGLDMAATETPTDADRPGGSSRQRTRPAPTEAAAIKQPREATRDGEKHPAAPKRRGAPASTKQTAAALHSTVTLPTDARKAAGSKRLPTTLPTPASIAQRPREPEAPCSRVVPQSASAAGGKAAVIGRASSPAVARHVTTAIAVPKHDVRILLTTPGRKGSTMGPKARRGREPQPRPVKWW